MKIIEVIADIGHKDTIKGIAEQQEIPDLWFGTEDEDGRVAARMVVTPDKRQAVIDSLQSILKTSQEVF